MIFAKGIAKPGTRIQTRIMFICVVPNRLKKGTGSVTGVVDDLGCALGHRILTIGEEPWKARSDTTKSTLAVRKIAAFAKSTVVVNPGPANHSSASGARSWMISSMAVPSAPAATSSSERNDFPVTPPVVSTSVSPGRQPLARKVMVSDRQWKVDRQERYSLPIP